MNTELIYLHGPPASGKYTVAKELAKSLDSKIFHNHLTIDVAESIFEFGTEEFWSLVHDLRLRSIKAAFRSKIPSLIFTNCYDHPIDLPFYEGIEQLAKVHGGIIKPFFLSCSITELESRVGNTGRSSMGKVSTTSGLREILNQWNCVPVPRSHCITINTENRTSSVTEMLFKVCNQC